MTDKRKYLGRKLRKGGGVFDDGEAEVGGLRHALGRMGKGGMEGEGEGMMARGTMNVV